MVAKSFIQVHKGHTEAKCLMEVNGPMKVWEFTEVKGPISPSWLKRGFSLESFSTVRKIKVGAYAHLHDNE